MDLNPFAVAALLTSAAALPAQNTAPGVTQLPGTACSQSPISVTEWPLTVSGSASIGGSLQLTPSMPVFTKGVIVGTSRLDLPLGAVFGCQSCTLVPSMDLFQIGGPAFTLTVAIPNRPSLIGLQVWAQPYYYDGLEYFPCSLGTGWAAVGDAVEITILP